MVDTGQGGLIARLEPTFFRVLVPHQDTGLRASVHVVRESAYEVRQSGPMFFNFLGLCPKHF